MYFIWVRRNDYAGSFVSDGYKYRQNAMRVAKKKFNKKKFTWIISKTNPWVSRETSPII